MIVHSNEVAVVGRVIDGPDTELLALWESHKHGRREESTTNVRKIVRGNVLDAVDCKLFLRIIGIPSTILCVVHEIGDKELIVGNPNCKVPTVLKGEGETALKPTLKLATCKEINE